MHARYLLALATILIPAAWPSRAAADEFDAKTLKPFLSAQTAAAAALDISDPATLVAVKSVLGLAPDAGAREAAAATIEKLRAAGVKRVYLVVAPFGLDPDEWWFLLASASAENVANVKAAFTEPSSKTWSTVVKSGWS